MLADCVCAFWCFLKWIAVEVGWLVDSWYRIAVWRIPKDFFLQEEDLLGPEAPRQGSSLSRRFVMLLGLKFGMVMKEVVVMLVSQVVVGYF